MNERIFIELYKKAWGHFPCPTGEPELEKFAELIIQKCISKIALVGISGFDNEDIRWAVQTAITSIEKHFGVEEQTIEQDQVPLPKNREQAMAMLRVATFYLDTQK